MKELIYPGYIFVIACTIIPSSYRFGQLPLLWINFSSYQLAVNQILTLEDKLKEQSHNSFDSLKNFELKRKEFLITYYKNEITGYHEVSPFLPFFDLALKITKLLPFFYRNKSFVFTSFESFVIFVEKTPRFENFFTVTNENSDHFRVCILEILKRFFIFRILHFENVNFILLQLCSQPSLPRLHHPSPN